MKRTILLMALLLWLVCPAEAQQTTQPTLSDVLENVLSSVVTVSVEKTEETKQLLGFRGNESEVAYDKILDLSNSKGSGSGFVIEKNGRKYVITNAHVIENASESAGSVFIYSINRTKYEAKVVGGDSFYDIAVLEFVKAPGTEVKAVTFAAKTPRIGEKVYAIGNPLGEYPYTVSDGIISAKNRVREGLTGKFGFLQSTATVIWGNSGGPLVNDKGQVVGINSQIAFAEMGEQSIWQPQINFALEGLLSKRIVDNIILNNGRVKRAYLGIELSQRYDYDQYTAMLNNNDGWVLTDSVPVISGVLTGSPAEAVLKNKSGWKLQKVNGTDIRNLEEALGEFEALTPGAVATLVLQMGTSTETVSITTQELEPQKSKEIAYQALQRDDLGLKLSELDGKVFITFNGAMAGNQGSANQGGTKGNRLRGNEITYGSWQVVAAGYDSDKFSSMWRVKSLSDLGAAIRLTASLGVIDLYLAPREGRKDDVKVKRISLAGTDENKWKLSLWY